MYQLGYFLLRFLSTTLELLALQQLLFYLQAANLKPHISLTLMQDQFDFQCLAGHISKAMVQQFIFPMLDIYLPIRRTILNGNLQKGTCRNIKGQIRHLSSLREYRL